MSGEPFVARRGMYGWHYASDALRHVEERNCAKGCTMPDPQDVIDHGPGGCCPYLARLITEEPIAEFEATDEGVTCHARQPIGGAA